MKKILLFILSICALALPCHAEKLQVVTTVPDLADLAKQVGGERVEVTSLANGVEDPHNVMLRPSMVTKLSKADLFIELGLDLEHAYAPALLAESRNSKIQLGKSGYLDCSVGVRVRDVPKSLDRSEGDVHPSGNPHYNIDPVYGLMMVRKICERLSELDPHGKSYFKKNADAYSAKLEAKIAEWKSKLSDKKIKFVSYHPDMVYFTERFGLVHVGTIQPKPGIEPSPRDIADLVDAMKRENVRLILKESFYSDRIPSEIASKTGAKVVSVPILVNGTPQAKNYISMIEQIVNAVAQGN